MASEKRVRFTSGWLPYALIFPQLLITIVFFFWPAGQALIQSLLVEDAFGASTEFVWFDNFRELFNDQNYLASFKVTAIFSVLVAGIEPATSPNSLTDIALPWPRSVMLTKRWANDAWAANRMAADALSLSARCK